MKYVTEYRNGEEARAIAATIAREVDPQRAYRFMEFCGGHTHVLSRWGLQDILPKNVQMIHGPGCPVCVLPIPRIDMAMQLALEKGVILCTYADTLRVPAGKGRSLYKAKADGADIRMVYSPMDAVMLAKNNPEREVVFFAIGFETTTPPTAVAIEAAQKMGLKNFSVFCNHVLTPAAMRHILESGVNNEKAPKLDGLVGPAHVSTIIGSAPYEAFAQEWKLPVVVAGFEPMDMLMAILMMVRQVNDARHEVENEFTRAVTREGNLKAQALCEKIFEVRDTFEWRGLGAVPQSALKIREAYADFDAEKRFEMVEHPMTDNKACACGEILRGEKRPVDCKLFGKACSPSHPIGACMVSSEGACAAAFSYERRSADVP